MNTYYHGTVIDLDGIGILIRGRPGSGKTDLALRLIDKGAVLVADDQVQLSIENGQVIATCPDTIRGLMEIKAIGVVETESKAHAVLGLVIDLVDTEEAVPEPVPVDVMGVKVPRIALNPFYFSAPQKVQLAANLIRGKTIARETFLGDVP